MDGEDGSGGGDGKSWLIGETDNITPTQVKEALLAGRGVLIFYSRSVYYYSNFTIDTSINKVLAAVYSDISTGVRITTLSGFCNNNYWSHSSFEISKDGEISTDIDIPTELPNPEALRIKDCYGSTLATYDGSLPIELTLPKSSGGSVEPLMGTYDELTPSDVIEALNYGRPVMVGYPAEGYGTFIFTNFGIISEFQVVIGSYVSDVIGTLGVATLMGSGNQWQFEMTPLSGGHLKGSTDEITPAQVLSAMDAGQELAITYVHQFFGGLTFTNFLVAVDMGLIVSSGVFELDGDVAVCQLAGSPTSGQWMCSITNLAKLDDIPTIPTSLPNPYLLTFKDSDGKTIGSYSGASATTMTIPSKLPNPKALTFTGAVTGTYDGSSAKTINIPTVAGTDGKTPVKGTDYWTPADQESMVQQVIAALGTPVYGWVDDANTIILNGNLTSDTYTIMYEDADGNQTFIGTLNGGAATSYINRLRESTDVNGGIYNGKGWKENMRISISSNGAEVAGTDCMLTGFIPVKTGDIVRLKNVVTTNEDYKGNVFGFDEDKIIAGGVNLHNDPGDTFGVVTENGNVVQFTVSKHLLNGDENGSGYIRISAKQFTNSSIITVNQEIV